MNNFHAVFVTIWKPLIEFFNLKKSLGLEERQRHKISFWKPWSYKYNNLQPPESNLGVLSVPLQT